MSAKTNVTYLQYRRALTRYYRYENLVTKQRLFSRAMRRHWRDQYELWTSGLRGVHISDATCAVMLGLGAPV